MQGFTRKTFKKACEILPKILNEDGYLWYLFVT